MSSVARRARESVSAALDRVFPPACALCEVELETHGGVATCEACRPALVADPLRCPRCAATVTVPVDDESGCPNCRDERLHFAAVAQLGVYEGALRGAVLRIKHESDRALAIALGELLTSAAGDRLAAWAVDAVALMPMHWSRRLRRGVNSPQIIADRIARRLRAPLAGHLLRRQRRTAPQADLSPAKRRANVRGAFCARRHPDLQGAGLLLVDDVMTTGATANEAAKTLTKAGTAWVAVAVLARA